MTYSEAVRFLYALGNEIQTAKLGLDRIGRVLEALAEPQCACRHVHVAGTNGKGSTCAMIEAGLRAAGHRTGLFTSPHLVEPTERIRIGGAPVSPERFTAAFERVHGAVEELLREGQVDLHTTYFETVTAMAFVLFQELGAERVVLETGLGGRLDATNVVTPELCVITPIDFDHEAFLGKSLESIAAEKAGILKRGVPAVIAVQREEAAAVLEARAAEVRAPLMRTSDWRVEELEIDARGSQFTLSGLRRLRIRCPLAGEHQVGNALAAAAALSALGLPDRVIQAGIAQARWPGRLERVAERPEIILDGAHNPAGARALAAYMERFYAGRRICLIYGAMRDKAVAEMSAILFPRADRVIATAPRQPRAVLPETIRELAEHPAVETAPRLEEALERARAASPAHVVFIAGSLFLVGEARALLCRSLL